MEQPKPEIHPEQRTKVLTQSAMKCIEALHYYTENFGEVESKQGRAIYFHLIQAKQALMKAVMVDDRLNLTARALVKEYERSLVEISR